jgi:hypothetical protein
LEVGDTAPKAFGVHRFGNLRYSKALYRQKVCAGKQNFHGLWFKNAANLNTLQTSAGLTGQ